MPESKSIEKQTKEAMAAEVAEEEVEEQTQEPLPAGARQMQRDAELEAQLDELRDEFGEATDILIDAKFQPDVAEFLLEKQRARFYCNRMTTLRYESGGRW
jgi:hypothetical protein